MEFKNKAKSMFRNYNEGNYSLGIHFCASNLYAVPPQLSVLQGVDNEESPLQGFPPF